VVAGIHVLPQWLRRSHRAVDKLKTSGILLRRVQVRSSKYLINVIEQDHQSSH
jgi:hypothetical protein